MRNALTEARVAPHEIGYINAHGSSTPLNDPTETTAIKQVFGAHAYRPAFSGTKGYYGHALGASGAIEAAICALASHRGWVPPTVNLDCPDPACDLSHVAATGAARNPSTCSATLSGSAASTPASSSGGSSKLLDSRMPSLTRRLTAEALGTFGLVFVGAAVVVVNGGFPNSGIGLIGIALAHAIVLSVMITATMTISGGHLNPAVTIGLALRRRIDPVSAAAYIAVQLAAACLAAFLVKLLLPATGSAQCHAGGPGDRQLRFAGSGNWDRVGSDVLAGCRPYSEPRSRPMLRGSPALVSDWCCCSTFWWAVR